MSGRGRQDHYAVLGVSSDAPNEVIRAAYRALAAKYPGPDQARASVLEGLRDSDSSVSWLGPKDARAKEE
jgi:hypothetical protein